MKRDMDLIRRILLDVENHQGSGSVRLEIEGHTREEVSYHVGLLAQAEYIKARSSLGTRDEHWIPKGLTWKGHEFLDDIRNDTVWRRVQDVVEEKGGSVSLTVMQALAVEVAKKVFGLGDAP